MGVGGYILIRDFMISSGLNVPMPEIAIPALSHYIIISIIELACFCWFPEGGREG